MKVLLDENLPHRLRNKLVGHDVISVRYQGWSGLKNGELLGAAESGGFEVFVTNDQTLAHDQNLTSRKIAMVVLSAIDWNIIRDSLPAIQDAIDGAVSSSFQWIDCGAFNRKLPPS